VKYSKNTSTDDIFNAIRVRNSLQQAHNYKSLNYQKRWSLCPSCEWTINNSRLDHWPVAPLISSWLFMSQQLFRTCFTYSMFLNFWR